MKGRRRSVPAALVLAAVTLTAFAQVATAAARRPTRPGGVAFATYLLPNGFDATNSGEPSIGVNWNTGNVLYQAGTGTYRASFNDSSRPPTVTWKDVSPAYTPVNLDPILATDSVTGRTLAGGDGTSCGLLALTLNDGDSWTPSVPCTGIIDHPTVGFGPPRPELGGVGVGARIAYFCQQYPLANECSRSLDGGTTWSPAVPVQLCLGLFGHLKTSSDGIAYLPSRECFAGGSLSGASGVGGAVSLDNGLTWNSYVIPGSHPDGGFDPSVAVASDGSLWESWGGDDNHLHIARSRDHGTTWSSPVDLSVTTSPRLAAATFPAVVAGDRDRVAVAYLGSTVPVPGGGDPYSSGYHGVWHLYYSVSYDAGASWTTQRISTDPVQRGWIDSGGTTASDHRNLLDFMDAALTKSGRVAIGYADGCTGVCADTDGTEVASNSSYGTVALQWQGKGLFAAYDKVNR